MSAHSLSHLHLSLSVCFSDVDRVVLDHRWVGRSDANPSHDPLCVGRASASRQGEVISGPAPGVEFALEVSHLGPKLVFDCEELRLPVLDAILRPHPRVPATIVARPEPHVAHGGLGEDDFPALARLLEIHVVEERVEKHRPVAVDEAPEGLRVAHYAVLPPFALRVVEEGAEEAGVEVVEQEREEVLVELERVRELVGDLPHAVDELQEHGRSVVVVVLVDAVAYAVGKLVPEAEPLLFDKSLKKKEIVYESLGTFVTLGLVNPCAPRSRRACGRRGRGRAWRAR